jgi:MFS transporter, PHS family, inorganic phosphate transporter
LNHVGAFGVFRDRRDGEASGRRSIQVLGFAMALVFLLIGIIPSATTVAWQFVLLYGISYFFTEFGPNTTTFIYPAEIFPVEVRTTGHGISAGAGKLGAFVGVVAAAGLLLTIAVLPEPKGKTLEQLSADAYTPAALKLEAAS